MRYWLAVALLAMLLLTRTATAQTAVPFSQRYQTSLPGDLIMLANAVTTCATPPCPTKNDSVVIVNSKLPADAGDTNIFNSASSDLTAANFPTGSVVTKAILYWGALVSSSINSASASGVPVPDPSVTTIKFATPGGAYQNLAPQQCAKSAPNNIWGGPYQFLYQCFTDVTASVAAAGVGTYKAGNIPLNLGNYGNRYAGWALVLVIRKPGGTLRNFTINDGLVIINSGGPVTSATINVSGFTTPLSGAVTAQVGVVAYDGDQGAADRLQFQGAGSPAVDLNDACNPILNNNPMTMDAFNSSICYLGSAVTTRSTVNNNLNNTLGYDADIIQLSNAGNANLGNGVTSAQVIVSSPSEGFWLGVVTTAIDVYEPAFDSGIAKTETNLTHPGLPASQAYAGDVIQYDIAASNVGQDNAANVVLTDFIPANATYVPGSLIVTSGANAGTKSDAANDDQAEYVATPSPQVVFRLGTGANAITGGVLRCPNCVGTQGTSTGARFQVQINSGTAGNTVINNSATFTFNGATSGQGYTVASNAVTETIIPQVNVSIAKTDNINGTYTPGGNAVYTITISNAGPDAALGVAVSDPLPQGVTLSAAWSCNSTTACHGCTSNGTACQSGTAGAGNGADVLSGLTVDIPGGSSRTITIPVKFSANPNDYN